MIDVLFFFCTVHLHSQVRPKSRTSRADVFFVYPKKSQTRKKINYNAAITINYESVESFSEAIKLRASQNPFDLIESRIFITSLMRGAALFLAQNVFQLQPKLFFCAANGITNRKEKNSSCGDLFLAWQPNQEVNRSVKQRPRWCYAKRLIKKFIFGSLQCQFHCLAKIILGAARETRFFVGQTPIAMISRTAIALNMSRLWS